MTENKRFERIYADVDVFCRDRNAKEASQLIEREDYDRIVDLLNEQHEQIERLKMNFRALDEVKCELAEENEQLKQSYNEFEDECQSTFNAMNRKQNDLYRKIFKLKDENEQLKQAYNDAKKDVEKKEQILKNIMEDNLLIQDMRNELKE